jgi:hypothetical protein
VPDSVLGEVESFLAIGRSAKKDCAEYHVLSASSARQDHTAMPTVDTTTGSRVKFALKATPNRSKRWGFCTVLAQQYQN